MPRGSPSPGTRPSRCSCRARSPKPVHIPRRRPAASGASPPRSPTVRRPVRRRPRRRARRDGPGSTPSTADRIGTGVTLTELPTDRNPGDRQGLHRLPERRDRQRHRLAVARGFSLDRAREALHDRRHGDRPGQDVQHQRSWRSPPARTASAFRRSGTPLSATPYTPVAFGNLRRLPPGRHPRARPAGRRSRPGSQAPAPSRAASALWQPRPLLPARRARTFMLRSPRECRAIAPLPASPTPRPWARSRSSAGRREFMNRLYMNPGLSSASAAAATASSSARTASSATTA